MTTMNAKIYNKFISKLEEKKDDADFQKNFKKNMINGEDGNSLHRELEEKLKFKKGEEIKEEAKEIKEEAKEIKEEAKEIKEGVGIEKLSMLDIMKSLKNLPESELRKVFNETKKLL